MIAVVAVILSLSLAATKLIYDGIFVRYDSLAQVPAELEATVNRRHSHSFPSGDNLLQGYLYRSPTENGTLVVLAPGFHAGADDYLWQIQSLLERGWSVFTYDGTGNCRSEGSGTVGFPQSGLDLEAALKYVEKCEDFGYNNIVLLGHSQGGYAAGCALRGEHDIAAVVTVSGINSAMEAIMGQAEAYVGPLAYANYGFLWLYQATLFGADAVNAQAAIAMGESNIPALVIHGSTDTQVSAQRGSILAHKDEIDSENIEFLLWDEPGSSDHTGLLYDPDGTANEELMETIHRFLLESIK